MSKKIFEKNINTKDNAPSVSMLVIGDEILNGRTADLNAAWLSKYLFKMGMNLVAVHFIRDDEVEIQKYITAAFNEANIVITSGGVGPTIDDKTKNVLAHYFNKKILVRQDIFELVSKNYLRFGRVFDQKLNYYHHFPEDFIGINNPLGLAPGLGIYLEDEQKLLLSGPGVPREFFAMTENEFYPLIKKYFSKTLKENKQVVIRTHSVPEEKIFNELCPNLWEELSKFGKVSSLPHIIGIDIVVSFSGDDQIYAEKLNAIKKIFAQGPLEKNIWQFGNKSLAELVFETAKTKNLTFGFAESCSGGLTSSKITDLSGISEVFFGSIISYDNSIKENVLNVKRETIQKHGAVSVECAKEMAIGALKILKTDIAISMTGIAGPTGGSEEKPVGTVVIGVATKDETHATLYKFPGDRLRLKDRFSEMGLLSLLIKMSEMGNHKS